MEKERLDILLVKTGHFQTREKARSAIMSGSVFINNQREDKPGMRFPFGSEIEIRENPNPYVSRGGLKLSKALNYFGIDLNQKIALDIGASTGGFTDCMLKAGAAKVFAIDVGYGQLAWVLRNDDRVVCMERTNVRYIKKEDIGILADFAAVDVSFISLVKILKVIRELLHSNGQVICLIKPQFEAGREKVGKHGVVREAEVHEEVIVNILDFSQNSGYAMKGLTYSPIKGPEGNIEYLIHLVCSREEIGEPAFTLIHSVVAEAHASL